MIGPSLLLNRDLVFRSRQVPRQIDRVPCPTRETDTDTEIVTDTETRSTRAEQELLLCFPFSHRLDR